MTDFEYSSSASSFGLLRLSLQTKLTIALDLILQIEKIAMTEDESLVASGQCLQLYPQINSRHY